MICRALIYLGVINFVSYSCIGASLIPIRATGDSDAKIAQSKTWLSKLMTSKKHSADERVNILRHVDEIGNLRNKRQSDTIDWAVDQQYQSNINQFNLRRAMNAANKELARREEETRKRKEEEERKQTQAYYNNLHEAYSHKHNDHYPWSEYI